MRHSIFILIILSTAIVSFEIEVNVEYKWKYCEYEWENQQQQKNPINSNSFNPYLCPFLDAAKADGKLIENIQKNCNFVQTLGKIYFRKNT